MEIIFEVLISFSAAILLFSGTILTIIYNGGKK